MNRKERRRFAKQSRGAAGAAGPYAAAFERAAAIHRSGRPREALRLYEEILAARPNDARAMNLAGVARFQLGEAGRAVEMLRAAVALDPGYADAHNNLGTALQRVGAAEDAARSFRRAVEINPGYAEAHHNLALALRSLGEMEPSVAACRRAIAIRPEYAEAHNNLGVSSAALGRLDEALASYGRAIAIRPEYAEAHYNTGNARRDEGRLDEAVASYRRAVEIDRGYAKAHGNLAAVLQILGRLDEALAAYRDAVALDPSNAGARHAVTALSGGTSEAAPREYVVRLFDDYAPRFEDHLVNVLDYRTPQSMRAVVDRMGAGRAGAPPFARALDLGCGTGLLAKHFRDIVGELHGVDLSPRMVARAEEKGIYDALHVGELVEFLEGASGEGGAYELIAAADVFIYIGNLAPVFAAVRRRLAGGGVFVFSVEDLDHGSYVLRETGRYAQSDGYIRELCLKVGFEVEAYDPVVVRRENALPIDGNVFGLVRTSD